MATCHHCGLAFDAERSTARYCSGACREASRRARERDAKGQKRGGLSQVRVRRFSAAKPQVSEPPCDANSASAVSCTTPLEDQVAALPPDLDPVERERWIAILTTPENTGWPGTCPRPKCHRPVAALDTGLCMQHDLEGPKQRRSARV